jgi:nucleoporin SEH1
MALGEEFDTGHFDRVTVLSANFTGDRILTASIDHRIKIWNRHPETGERTLTETITAHDADIRDAKFLHPTTGSHFASIGNDLKFHLWSEDVSQAPNSGRRFRRMATIASTPRVPFVSMDIKTIDSVYTYIALIDRQGLLSIYEPSSPDDFKEWTLIDIFNVCGSNPPGRGEETSFKVRWDPNITPLAYTNSLSDDRTQLSLVVTALNEVKIYRAITPSVEPRATSDGASHLLMLHEAVRLPRHPDLVRDVAWAPFSVRGTDRIATACKDGTIRIFELSVSQSAHGNGSAANTQDATSSTRNMSLASQKQQPQSHLTSAITGRNTHAHNTSTTGNQANHHSSHAASNTVRSTYSFPFQTTIQSTSTLQNAHSDAWTATFDSQGQVLMTNGSDGVTKIWRKSILGGQWLVFAGQEILDEEDGGTEDGSDDGLREGN